MYKNSSGVGDHRKVLSTPAGQQVTGYTTEELQRMKAALSRKLGPEFISKRKGPGFSSVQYLEGWKAINLANEIFGPNGWCTELKEFKVDYIDDRHGAISMGLSCIVRVILKDGTYHEDIGYGSIDNCKNKAAAFDKCKKEAFTDGMKRALRQFGNALGNCLYDKEYLQQITKVTSEPNDFDASALLRRSTTLPKVFPSNPEPTGLNNGNNELKREISNTEEVGEKNGPANNTANTTDTRGRATTSVTNTATAATAALKNVQNAPGPGARSLSPRKSRDDGEDSFMFSDDWPEDDDVNNQILKSNNYEKEELPDSDFDLDEEPAPAPAPATTPTMEMSALPVVSPAANPDAQASTITNTSAMTTVPERVTFVPATSADTIQQDPTLQTMLKFDVTASNSQIAKSSFINHSKSLPVKRSLIQGSGANKVTAGTGTTTAKPLNGGTRPLGPLGARMNAAGNNAAVGVIQLNSNLNSNPNPLVKRAFGLPPERMDSKRLRK